MNRFSNKKTVQRHRFILFLSSFALRPIFLDFLIYFAEFFPLIGQ